MSINYDQLLNCLSSCRTERRKYYKHINKARTHGSDKYISLIIDGTDQHTTAIPKFNNTPKAASTIQKLQTHVTGVIVHGRGQHTYIDYKEHRHDSNLTINILLSILNKYKDSLPPVLYIQLDNTARENKNKHLFAFCSLLVQIFRKVI